MTIYSWWPTAPAPGNFGDILTPYLIHKLTGSYPELTYVRELNHSKKNVLAVGSIIKFADYGTVVWGSGLMSVTDSPSPLASYRAVRGPLTRKRVLELGGNCPAVYGDPALLMPRFYQPKIEKTHRYGIIPHYVDYEQVSEWYRDQPAIKVINILNADVEAVVDDIVSCENLISSSLHGIIAAHAYGVKAHWVKFSDKLRGDGTKFLDYFASVGIEMERQNVEIPLTLSQIAACPYVGDITFDDEPLFKAFPYAT